MGNELQESAGNGDMTESLRAALAEIPWPVQWAVFGSEIPAMAITAMRRLEAGWRECGNACENSRERMITASGSLAGAVGGAAAGQIAHAVRQHCDVLANQRDFCHGMADQCGQSAADTEKSIWEMVVFGLVITYQVLFLVSSGGIATLPGLALLSKARAKFLLMLERCITGLRLTGARAMAARVGLLGATFGSLSGAVDYSAQKIQVMRGDRDYVNSLSVVTMGLQGIGAVAGGHLGVVAAGPAASLLGRATAAATGG
ncbi:MAG: hypothetical protein HOQ24_02000, partial [Mycobacteriaceae bacterium]|nr:hypothetical protein [Mycobacteriaceae bacterium]